ncbi:hypothetical protein P3L10_011711 [Capsicum annuum]
MVIAVVTDGGVDCNVEFSCYVDSMISTFECVHDRWAAVFTRLSKEVLTYIPLLLQELIEPGSVLKVVLLVF